MMKSIISSSNSLYKEIRQLANSPQARRKSSRTIVDGIHLCQSYLEYVGTPLFCVINESSQDNPEINRILVECQGRNVPIILLTDTLYHAVSQVEEGAGIFYVIMPSLSPFPGKLSQTSVLLDRIQDPGNLGSILRSASAAGITEIFCSKGTSSAWSPRVLRAGMGAHFLIKIYEDVDLISLIETSDIKVVATKLKTEKSLYDINLTEPVAWVFGHEGQGITEELQLKTNIQVTIPHVGKQESLNVAACAAICFFEQLRQQNIQHQ